MQTILIAAITLDGKIAKDAKHNNNWTSRQDKDFFRSMVKKAGVVVFGASTYQAMGCRAMPGVLNLIITRKPEQNQFQFKKDLLEFTADLPHQIISELEKRGYKTLIIAGGQAIYSLFLQEKLIDEVYLTIVPKIFGQGLNLFKEIGDLDMNLELIDVSRLGKGEILVKYKLCNNL